MHSLRCYRCGASLADYSLPLSRHDRCPECAADLHACRMCASYDPRLPAACAEEAAEEVHDKIKANFCEYFVPSEAAFAPGRMTAHQEAEAALKALFGDPDEPSGSKAEAPARSDEPEAWQRAESLFKDP